MTETDRELLELAAKAAGIVVLGIVDGPDGGITHWWKGAAWDFLIEGVDEIWNPLTDDGDALRLAVKLNIWPVRQYDRPIIVVQNGAAYFDELASEPIGDDACAATRRAIVRAAAEIGRNMK